MPIPVPNFDNAGFWEGCRQHELRIQRCTACGALRHPPRPMCPHCGGVDSDWMRASGRGSVFSFTIVHGPTLPVFQAQAPYNVVVVQLDEGPYIVSNLVDCRAEQIRIGVKVEVVFEGVDGTMSLPRFRVTAKEGA
ncbi:MAG: Zn-ribbon domain-containing OB-fold protein [Deltaproteobacteria bacterium]|nr:Zn-ribbon domain-containing OB-fold protein [Deltaproteobacteria bacterium]MBI3391014.1 Zn-ribbon domain-containing OB-fold protein [Deltaproteobacteria bacterium]